jgi:hypothetical protein
MIRVRRAWGGLTLKFFEIPDGGRGKLIVFGTQFFLTKSKNLGKKIFFFVIKILSFSMFFSKFLQNIKEGTRGNIFNLNISSYFEDCISIFLLRNTLSWLKIIKAKSLKKYLQRQILRQASANNLWGVYFYLGYLFVITFHKIFPERDYTRPLPNLVMIIVRVSRGTSRQGG